MNSFPAMSRVLALAGLGVLAALASPAQSLRAVGSEDPAWLKVWIRQADALFNVESERESTKALGSDQKQEYLYMEPAAGVDVAGSLYHPNLVSFDLEPQIGVGWQETSATPPGGTREDTDLLQRYHANMTVLREKPVATHLFADKDTTYRDFDFYTRGKIDATRYGGESGYAAGPVPFHVRMSHADEDVSGGVARPSHSDQDTLMVDARNERRSTVNTEFRYTVDQYHRREEGLPDSGATSHNADLFDSEKFGAHDWVSLQSGLTYGRLDDTTVPTEDWTYQENLGLEHTRNLSSHYRYAYDTRKSGPDANDSHDASAALHHQLFESLASTFELHGTSQDASGPDHTSGTRRYGAEWSEAYTKRLGSWGRLTLGDALRVDHEKRDVFGRFITVVDEAHTLALGGPPVFLNRPDANLETVRVTDGSRLIPYAPGLDYNLVPHGSLTEIQRLPGGMIPSGGTVLVSYTAAGQPSGTFDTVNNNATFRLDLFDGLLAFYARLGTTDNSGGEGLILETSRDTVTGAETRWRWVHLGIEHEQFDSNLTPFTTDRLFENLDFPIGERSILSFSLSQSRITFPYTSEEQTSEDYISRYHVRLTPAWGASAEGGIRHVRGEGIDQDLKTARTSVDFAYGQLTANLGYEYQDRRYLGQLLDRQYLYLKMRRTF